MWTETKIYLHEYFLNCALLTLNLPCFKIDFILGL